MSKNVMSFIQIGKCVAKNRFVCPPMGTNYASIDGYMSHKFIQHYKKLVHSGCGIVIVEAVNVEKRGMITKKQLNAYQDGFSQGISEIVEEAKKNNVLLLVQLCHGGMFGGAGEHKKDVIAPSSTDNASEMSVDDFEVIKNSFLEAALKVRESGADGIELHMAHGYLLAEFISQGLNKRHDQYGGSLENRMRFPIQILREIREQCGSDFIIQIRISATEKIECGNKIDESIKVCQLLEQNGADCIHVSCGVKGTGESSPYQSGDNKHFLINAKKIKEKINIPVVAVGKIATLELANQIIEKDIADMVAIGRPLIMDNQFVERLINGEKMERCLYCNKGCLERAVQGKEIQCIKKR